MGGVRKVYGDGHWRTDGLTAQLIVDVCEGERLPAHALHGSHLIYSYAPKDHAARAQAVCFNIWEQIQGALRGPSAN